MISRRQLVCMLALGGLMPPLARAQTKTRMRRIGFLGAGSASGFANHVAGLRTGLRELGYEERKNLAIEFRWAEGNFDRLGEFAQELLRLPAEVIISQGTPATLAAKKATTTV